MTDLFTPFTLNNGVEIKNRLVVAPMTHFGSNPDGTISDAERQFIGNRATDFGLFITAATLVKQGGKSFVGEPEATSTAVLDSLAETANVIKNQGAKAILQLHHGGKNGVSTSIKALTRLPQAIMLSLKMMRPTTTLPVQ